jgi:hypothetical protein
MVYVGLDLHKRYITASALDTDGRALSIWNRFYQASRGWSFWQITLVVNDLQISYRTSIPVRVA